MTLRGRVIAGLLHLNVKVGERLGVYAAGHLKAGRVLPGVAWHFYSSLWKVGAKLPEIKKRSLPLGGNGPI